jgi:hypothetical protein
MENDGCKLPKCTRLQTLPGSSHNFGATGCDDITIERMLLGLRDHKIKDQRKHTRFGLVWVGTVLIGLNGWNGLESFSFGWLVWIRNDQTICR